MQLRSRIATDSTCVLELQGILQVSQPWLDLEQVLISLICEMLVVCVRLFGRGRTFGISMWYSNVSCYVTY